MWVLAVSGTAPGYAEFAQYGALGVAVFALGMFSYRAWKREVDRSDRLEAELSKLNQTAQDKMIPALQSATDALKEATVVIAQASPRLKK